MTREEQDKYIAHVFKNRELIMTEKKNTVKHADVVINLYAPEQHKGANKAAVNPALNDPTVLLAKLVINTTRLIDSHRDCHIDGIWDKTLKETSVFYLLQEHSMKFDRVIADSVNDGLKAFTESVTWKELGLSYDGDTQALMFEAKIKQDRNPFMFEQYKKGYVLNHSVGMRYVKLFLCINRDDPAYSQEKENWDKYYPTVANKEEADSRGLFWAVTEAKMIEGSAVLKGSNFATPVYEIEAENKSTEAASSTSAPKPEESTSKTDLGNYLF